ncbi:MAG TPA: hypothetical protein DDY14_14900 [Chromatiaceae bacterium]|jgi:hypothetical protein|nr:MAG: hypothetical protein N838_12985 [Thiohalocapsa sp. PB-PSB1]QQO53814.1 MAG: hypothetical protein N838_11050 [Thiohalocapsa sp. PB-PSB1]HBG96571.1 hypothetical protein [Chromatiaceae bacterium]HCS88861.1 hypothetical protein [Chromatiaceae bacterium]
MEMIQKTQKNLIYKKRSGRYAVMDRRSKKWVNGDAKADILLAEALITRSEPKPSDASAETSAETVAEGEEQPTA